MDSKSDKAIGLKVIIIGIIMTLFAMTADALTRNDENRFSERESCLRCVLAMIERVEREALLNTTN